MQGVARALGDGPRNYGVSPRQFDAAADALRARLRAGDQGAPAAALADVLKHAESIHDIAQALCDERADGGNAPLLTWPRCCGANVMSHLRDIPSDAGQESALSARMEALANRSRAIALSMEFGFLVEPERRLLTIGYRVADRAQDPSCYDLLASEARLASFVAIAKGDLPVRHWFRLGRLLTPVDRSSALVSWSGSMFEYLMPVLIMREPEGSVLGETARLIVKRQIEYGNERNLPWGISESAFNARDREFTYQYSSFGVPGLGLQRGLGDEAVVAPYATGLAAMIDPAAAARNFERMEALGARGRFGWYEALDFSPKRLPEGVPVVAVRTFMAHHQGMILTAIANVLKDGMFRRCFHSNSLIQATELLLQEKTPRESDLSPPADEAHSAPELRELAAAAPRRFTSPHHVAPRTHLLSNGNYSLMVSAAGSGYSRWRDIAVTRWREDPTCDSWGSYVFLRDVANGQVWSAGYQPVGREPDRYDVAFFEDRAEITRRDGPILTSTEILVSPEDDAEVRLVSVTNEGNRAREIELTTYAEVVLATAAADSAHPAFSKLFVQTRIHRRERRPARDPAGSRARRGAALGRPRQRPGGRRHRGPAIRDGSRALSGPRARFAQRRFHRRRAAFVEHGGHGARSRTGIAPARADSARRDCARRLLDGNQRQPGGRGRAGGQTSRHGRLRPRKDAGMDPGPGAAAVLRDRLRGRPAISARGQSRSLRRLLAACLRGRPREESAGTFRLVGPRHIRRPAHRARQDRRRARHGNRQAAAARA